MIERMMEKIKAHYSCKEIDAGIFSKIVIDGANFRIRGYNAAGLGRVSTVQMKRLFGAWEMQTLIINPLEVDMPIFYYIRHKEKGSYFYRMEMFDTQMTPIEVPEILAVNEKYAALLDEPQNPRWYDDVRLPGYVVKKVDKKEKSELEALAWEHFNAYFEMLSHANKVKSTEKKKKATVFVDELCEKSGIAIIEIFIANYGEKIASKLANEVLFGLRKVNL